MRPDDLWRYHLKVVEQSGLDGAVVDDVQGCANQAGEDNRNIARMSLLLAGCSTRSGRHRESTLCIGAGGGEPSVLRPEWEMGGYSFAVWNP